MHARDGPAPEPGPKTGGSLPSPASDRPSARRSREHSFNSLRWKEFGETVRVIRMLPMLLLALHVAVTLLYRPGVGLSTPESESLSPTSDKYVVVT